MKRLLPLILMSLLLSCGSEDAPEPVGEEGVVVIEPMQPTQTPVVPSLDEVKEVLKSAGGRAVGVTNEALYVIEDVQLIAYNPQDERTCRVQAKLQGHLSEPWMNVNEVYQKGQELIYMGDYEMRLNPTGEWEMSSIISLQRTNIEESPATIVTPITDDDFIEEFSPELTID